MKKITSFLATSLALFTVFSAGMIYMQNDKANAVTGADWRAGHIISDNLFYDNNSMSVSEIQDFLNRLVPACDTNGNQPARDFGRADISRAEYARRVGWPGPPYVCLRDYYQVPRSDQIINNYSGHRPAGSISAAEIIKRAADTYGISPKALLVLLQKESPGPLPLDTWPLQNQYRNAMGSGCPDTAPCDPRLAGFYNQMMSGAERFRVYYNNPGSFRHQVNRGNPVYYHPDLQRCGNSQVHIETHATAGLYNYTPYQPNQAALNNLAGTGDSCSAYGNRNFWRIYQTWFGSTTQAPSAKLSYESLETPRWMRMTKDLRKRDPRTGRELDGVLTAGSQLWFQDKVLVDGVWYLRTKWDKDHNEQKGVPISELVDPVYESMETPRWMKLHTQAHKVTPRSDVTADGPFAAATELEFVDKYIINETVYLRTRWDAERGIDRAFVINSLTDFRYEALREPVWMSTVADTTKVPPGMSNVLLTLPAGYHLQFFDKVTIQGVTYYRTAWDAERNNHAGIPETSLSKIGFEKMPTALRYKLKEPTSKLNASSLSPADGPFPKDTELELTEKITINGMLYYRTAWDSERNIEKIIPASMLY